MGVELPGTGSRGPKRLDTDPLLVLELAVCAQYRIPHSEFLGWSGSDRDKAVWWHLRKSETCTQCGTRPQEWDPERGGRRRAYSAEIHQCEGCVVRQRAETAPEMTQARGMHVVLVRNEEMM